MYTRKEKEKEMMEHHLDYLQNLKTAYQFTVKTAFFSKGKVGRNIQLFENELSRGSDIYVELVDFLRDPNGVEIDMVPMYEERPLFKYRYNPYFSEEYEPNTGTSSRGEEYTTYVIPASELVYVTKDGSEMPYNQYEKYRLEEPKKQTKLSVFPNFEEEFLPKIKQESNEVSSILLEIASGFQKLAEALKDK
jgi:hypothetical protein